MLIAEPKRYDILEGNVYFPADSIKKEYFKESSHTSVCPWKGTSNYYTIVVEGKENENAAWTYKEPKKAAAKIKGHVAVWKGSLVFQHNLKA